MEKVRVEGRTNGRGGESSLDKGNSGINRVESVILHGVGALAGRGKEKILRSYNERNPFGQTMDSDIVTGLAFHKSE